MGIELFNSIKGDMIHYFVRPEDNFILNTLEKLDANAYLYRLLRDEGYQQIFFIDIGETNYSVLAYDQFSYWATVKPLDFANVDMEDPSAVFSFLGSSAGTAKKTTAKGLNTKFTKTSSVRDSADRSAGQRQAPLFGKCRMQTFASPEEFIAFMLNRISPALNSNKVKTAVVMPMEMFEQAGRLTQTTIDAEVINTIRNAQKNNQGKNNIIVLTTVRQDNLAKCIDIPNFQDLHYWVPGVLRRASYQDDRVALAVDTLQNEGILVLADSICEDEVANLLLRKKFIEHDPLYDTLSVSKIYHLAELLAEQCRMERRHFQSFTPFRMHDYIRQLDRLLSDPLVAGEIIEKSRTLKVRIPGDLRELSAVALDRVTHRNLDRCPRSQEEILSDYEQAMAPLNGMIGLENIKNSIRLQLNTVLDYGSKQGPGHYVFAGNPGTGKTEVARLMGDVFKALGLLKKGHLVECRKRDLVAEHVGGSAIKTMKKCTEALDGVLFVDEAYELVNLDSTDRAFKTSFDEEAYNEIMTFMENNRQRICVIFAGYTKEMQAFVEANPGMIRRISKVIDFSDYNVEELFQIFRLFAGKEDFVLSEEFETEIRKVIGKLAKHPGPDFGNAGAMRKLFQSCRDQAAQRFAMTRDEENKYRLLAEDIPEDHNLRGSEEDLARATQELNELIGLESVKTAIQDLLDEKQVYGDVQETGHFVFTGNPGTGKTEVARKLGKIFKAMGLLSKGHVVECTEADLVAQYTGQTAVKTRSVCQRALDGVLFVDEAYRLVNTEPTGDKFNSPFAEEAYTELMTFMENNRHRVCVVVAGYADLMEKFLDANDGMRSRVGNIIHFPDYTDEELLRIIKLMASREGYTFASGFEEAALHAISVCRQECTGKFANAREARNLLAAFRKNVSARMRALCMDGHSEEVDTAKYILTAEDTLVGSQKGEREDISTAMADLNELIGLDSVKQQVKSIYNRMRYAATPGKSIDPGHYIFAGNPGTGKTEVARLMGRIFKAMGILSKGHVVEVSRVDLVGGWVGRTAIKTADRCKEALGGILFVDEAYTLIGKGENDFGPEALETIMKFMEDNRSRICVIFAGYEDRMAELMAVNLGISSRIKNVIHFQNYSPVELQQILCLMARKAGLEYTEDFLAEAGDIFAYLMKQRGNTFGNAREARKLLDAADERRSNRIAAAIEAGTDPDSLQRNLLTADDLDLSYKAQALQGARAAENQSAADYRRIPAGVIRNLAQYDGMEDIHDRIQLGKVTDPSILFIRTDAGEGTAFLISPDGYALTCNHVINGAHEIQARFRMPGRPGQEDSWHTCQVVNTKFDLDIALLKLEGENFPYLRLASPDREIRKGEEFLLSGYPFGNRTAKDLTTFYGYVASSERQTDENGLVRYNINSEAKSGNSGAPIIALSDGCVIGLLLGSMTGSNRNLVEEINYMRPIFYFWEEFLE